MGGWDHVILALARDDRGADREELDHVAAPAMALLLQVDADDALGGDLLRLGLHALHRELARVVERLREVRELDVTSGLGQRLEHAPMGDVVDAAAHHHANRAVSGLQQRPELLAGEVAGERAAIGRAVKLAVAVLDRRADRDELGHVLAPLVAADVESHADDPVGAELLGLLLHARHRQLARAVHRLREYRHLLALFPAGQLEADVVDRAADHQPERLEARLLDQQELVDGQVGREQAGAVLLQASRPACGTPSSELGS